MGRENPALAARRADTGDHSVVVVLWPLHIRRPLRPTQIRLRCCGAFFAARHDGILQRPALFRQNSDMTRKAKWFIGAKCRGKQQREPAQDLGPGKFGQCAKSIVVPARTRSRL